MIKTSPKYPKASRFDCESINHLSWKVFKGAKKDTQAVIKHQMTTIPVCFLK